MKNLQALTDIFDFRYENRAMLPAMYNSIVASIESYPMTAPARMYIFQALHKLFFQVDIHEGLGTEVLQLMKLVEKYISASCQDD